jgi:hypothetical protein
MDRQVRLVAQEFVRDCLVEIDDLIYSKPAPDGYTRTKNLRNGHKIKKLGDSTYLIGNYVPYAIFQHDGWTSRGGNWNPGRPWMEIALYKNTNKYVNMLDKSIADMWGI